MKRTWERHEVTEAFVRIMNICEPNHSYYEEDEQPWPIKPEDVDVTWKKSTSRFLASCGPRSGTYKAKFAVDLDWWNRNTPERGIVTLIHEVTHIEEGRHTEGSSHNPAFWEAFAKNVNQTIEWIELLQEFFPEHDIDTEQIINEAIEDPNSTMIDKRMETLDERKQALSHSIKKP